MATEMIAMCGLNCMECEAYIATQANDIDTLTKLSNDANQQSGMHLNWQDSLCDGCIGEGRQIGYCSQCKVRNCATEHQVENCAYCPEYGCTTITEFFEMAPKAKSNLDAIYAALN
ncbi:MAG: DUF3795 domain-containing protein [candidate division Zixibacteria bacterium]|nr:DUF3795 domain-containing protein [Gammaproteobacteria bacterium]NIX55211.1 DUF3795 domain-containing protein [candidate division Zixibacteria bacterium]